ncbi:MAG: pyridoxal-phosphate dependent enzyme [Ilumatobacteraceae bacterium]
MSQTVDLDDILAARAVVDEVARHTPVVPSSALSNAHGGNVMLKAENLQLTGSFKLRGAMNKLASLGDAVSSGVTTGSAGNHAQAIAFAARHFDVPCSIFVPVGAPITKIEASRNLGATVVETGPDLSAAVVTAQEHAARTGMTYCAPFDDVAVVAGQGTLGLELLDDIDDLETLIVPIGGGGLISGTAIAVKSLRPHVRVVGVQARVCSPYVNDTAISGPVLTLADGIAVKYPGAITRPLVSHWVDEIVTVDEDAIADAMVLLLDRAKLTAEGAGAVGVAALMAGEVSPPTSGTTCVVVSGGNVDLGVLPGLIRRHENAQGRRLSIVARIDDRPGGLATLLAVFADGGADLIEVEHIREGLDLHVRETGIHATFEVRSAEQGRGLVEGARAAGYVIDANTD